MSYSTSGPVETILRKEDTVDPVAGNDNTQGYDVQSRWINTSSNEEWVCTDASTGAALWELTTGGDGDVVGPASAVWHDVAKFNGTTGKLIETSTLNVNTAGQVLVQGTAASLDINERTTGPGLTAGRGKVWVRDDTPSALIFTNDAGTEHQLTQDLNGAGVPGAATGDGYPLGTTYADTTNDVGYILVDATVGVNVWWTGGAATPTPTTLASNALIDVDATEVVIGGAYLDGSSGGVYSWEILGTYNDNGGGGNQDVIVTLYDRGPDGTPVAGVLRSTITITSLDTLDRVSQALTVASSPGVDADAIDSDEPRLYEIRAKLDASGGVDTASILNVKFIES